MFSPTASTTTDAAHGASPPGAGAPTRGRAASLPSVFVVPPWRALRAGFVFLTRVPVGGFPYRDQEFRAATAYFPVVGLIQGMALVAAWALLSGLPPWPRATLVVALSLLFTGAFHEDGLADTADALGGAQRREQIFTILKDSRLGTFGVAALTLALLLRVSLLAALAPRSVFAGLAVVDLLRWCTPAVSALLLSSSLSRLPPLVLMATMPYVSESGRAKSAQVTSAGRAEALVAALFSAGLVALLVGLGVVPLRLVLWAVLGASLLAALAAYRFHRRTGGITGDFLGATQQLAELALLLVLAAS